MATVPTTIVVYSTNKIILPVKDLYVAVKYIFVYGVKNIVIKGEKILVHLTYTPKADTLKKKFGDLPVMYLRLRIDSEQELKTLERLLKRFKFNVNVDDEALPAIEATINKKRIIDVDEAGPSTSGVKKLKSIDDVSTIEDLEIFSPDTNSNLNNLGEPHDAQVW